MPDYPPLPLRWLIDGGTGHALAAPDRTTRFRHRTACGIQTDRGRVIEGEPHAVCGRCRNVLAFAGIDLRARGDRSR